ncbi:1-phosphatidylinositol 4,5-bisphosphate phosphodiesterase beta-2 [Vanacampus margaritifer]
MNKKRYFLDSPVVKDYMVKGERFTKWSEDSTKTVPVTMKMDTKGFYLYWMNQSKETTFLDVATIRDTRTGKYAKLPKHPKVRNVFNLDFPDSNHLAKTLTVVSGLDTVNLTYHNFFASKDKVTQNWATDILAIACNAARNNACRQIFLDKCYVRICLQTNKDGKIPVKNIYKMFPADKKRVESALASAHLPKGKFDSMKPDVFTESAFKAFLANLCPRPEIYEIFTSYSNKPTMTRENFTKFLNEKQRDSRLNEELFPRLRQDQIKALMVKYEPCNTNCNRGLITPETFLSFLMGPETSVVMQDRLAKCQDMTQPLPHYFIKSSHNTYLTAGQFSGVSSPEMYRQCLLSGCRCLELDCWKGKPPEEEPIITHGFTMTSEILFKDVIEAIAESAFKTSQYPLILSFENHVDSVKQQEKMANYCKTIFGNALLTEPLDKYPLKPGQQIPSPSELMGKILIKNKKGNHENTNQTTKRNSTASSEQMTTDPLSEDSVHSTSRDNQDGDIAVDDNEDQEDTEEQDEEKMKTCDEGTAGQEVTAYEAMSSLVNYIQPNKFVSFDNARKKNKSYVISSFVETKGEAMIAKTAVEFVEYNKRQMSRIYPKGTRMDSSNFSPQPFWNVGCQMVALNYQTMDFPMQLNMAVFEFNGRTGYLLKHDVLRRGDKKFDPFCDRIDTVVAITLTIKIYSGQFLSDKSVKTGVEVEIVGLPGDPKKKYRTKWSTTPNSINPVWNEEPFVFDKILLPEMASLRMAVYEENGKFLGHRILPLDAIQSGFHHICLRSESNMPLTLPALFVYIEVKDYIPAAFADFTDALFNPTKGTEKTTRTPKESSSDYISPYELPLVPQNEVSKAKEPAAEAPSEPNPPGPEGSESPSHDASPDATCEDAEEESTATATQPEDFPPDAEPGSLISETLPGEEIEKNTTKDSEESSSDSINSELISTDELAEEEVQGEPGPLSASPECAVSDKSSAVCGEAPPANAVETTVMTAELTQHKSYLKVVKRQEKETKEVEKKYQRKTEELSQKYSDAFKACKKKASLKKKDASLVGGGSVSDCSPKTAQEHKQKLQAELHALWTQQCEQLRRKKEQYATERLAKLMEMANERHSIELKTLESEIKESKKRNKSSPQKAKLKKATSTELLDEPDGFESMSCEYSMQQESLMMKQAATLEEIKALTNQLNQDALKEHQDKMRSLPAEVMEAVNARVGAHFPELVEKAATNKAEGSNIYGDVFLG